MMCGTCGGFYNERCPHWPLCHPAADAHAPADMPPRRSWWRRAGRAWGRAQHAQFAGRLASLRQAVRGAFGWFVEPLNRCPEPWSRRRVIELLTRLRAAESFIQDPLLGDAIGAIEWLMQEPPQ